MTAVRVNDEIVILDMGFFLPSLINFEEEGGDRRSLNREGLIKIGAIPDDNALLQFRQKVKAIVLGHCHLDHIGAAPWLAPYYTQAPIIGTPYTMQVLRNALNDDKIHLSNKLVTVKPNHTFKVTKNITIELIHVNHSTLHTAIVAIHTPEGSVLYANDYKMDQTPVVGDKVNVKRLKELGKENVRCLISNSLYSNSTGKTASEMVAREQLKQVMLDTENNQSAIFGTAFASHIPRLKSFYDFGQKLDRNVVFMGRSLQKYINAAREVKLIDFPHAEICTHGSAIKRTLKDIEKNRKKYLVICTGGQGEPGSVLTRITHKQFPFNFSAKDHMIFSNRVIPAPINLQNRQDLEEALTGAKVRMFKDVHVSGHGSQEDIRELIHLTKPKVIIPTHGYPKMYEGVKTLAEQEGYVIGKTLRLARTGQIIEIP